jgi:hypothetical protein
LVGRRVRQRKVEEQEMNVQMRPMVTGPQGVASMHIRQIMATMSTMVRMLMQPIGTGVVVVMVVVVVVMVMVMYTPLVHRRMRVANRRRRNGNRHQHGCQQKACCFSDQRREHIFGFDTGGEKRYSPPLLVRTRMSVCECQPRSRI